MNDGLRVFVGDNFKVEGQEVLSTNDAYLKRADVHFDERANFLTRNLNVSNWDWYYNYLEFMQIVANKNPQASPTYLLDLGYVPVVYLPSCCESLGARLMEAMDVKKIPYVKLPPTSFVLKHYKAMTIDAWVSKMDVYERLGVAPNEVTSEMILRRLVLNGQ